MNPSQDDRLEHIVSRSLDGMLSEDEAVELGRTVLRDPDARRLMEEGQRIDALASAALERAVPDSPPAFDPLAIIGRRPERSGASYHRAWWLLPAAIAAALGTVFFVQPPTKNAINVPVADARRDTSVSPAQQRGNPSPVLTGDSPYQLINSAPRRTQRMTDRELLGVIGEDGNIYWIEIDRTRTIKSLKSSGVKLISGDL